MWTWYDTFCRNVTCQHLIMVSGLECHVRFETVCAIWLNSSWHVQLLESRVWSFETLKNIWTSWYYSCMTSALLFKTFEQYPAINLVKWERHLYNMWTTQMTHDHGYLLSKFSCLPLFHQQHQIMRLNGLAEAAVCPGWATQTQALLLRLRKLTTLSFFKMYKTVPTLLGLFDNQQ